MLVALPAPPKIRGSVIDKKFEGQESVIFIHCSENFIYIFFIYISRASHVALAWTGQGRDPEDYILSGP